MIDITKAKKAFKEYIQNYDINNPKVKLKIAHIERTANIARKTAESLNLEKEDLSGEVFTKEIYREFIEDKTIFYPNMQTYADRLIGHFAFVYNFNYQYGLKTIYDNEYYTKIYNRFKFNNKKTEEEFKNIYEITINYIKERLNKNDVRYSKNREKFILYSESYNLKMKI